MAGFVSDDLDYVVIRAVIDAPCQQQGRLFLSGHSETGEVSETTVLFDENLILLTVLPESRYTVGVQTTAPYCHPSTFQLELVRAEGSCFSFFLFREEQQGVALRVNNKTIDALLTLTCDRSELLEAFATRPVESDVVRSDLGIWFYRAFVAFALSLLLFSLL